MIMRVLSRISTFFVRVRLVKRVNKGCERVTSAYGLQVSRQEPAEFTVYVRKEGKITVPKEVRDALRLERGDLVRCRILKVQSE